TTPASGSSSVRVSAGRSVRRTDFGNTQNAAITGYVFKDINADGQWDRREVGLRGRQVFLDLNDNDQWDSGELLATTNRKGYFQFNAVAPGHYAVREILPAGWRQTLPTDAVYGIAVTSGQVMDVAIFGNAAIS
ncbi:MAG: SdrD B-like domain-containing protein, partial [Bacillota bacterium]